LAEFGTLYLEFFYLSEITGDPVYKKLVQNIRDLMNNIVKEKGLYPIHVDLMTGKPFGS
jgi:hypothetical protein